MTEIERLQENANQINSDFQAIKSAIVDSGVEVAEGTRTQDYGAKVRKVYEQGKQTVYDALFHDSISFIARFAGKGWNNDTFKPNRSLEITGDLNYLFYNSNISGSLIEIAKNLGISITIKPTMMQTAFSYSGITEVEIDCSIATSMNYAFADASKLATLVLRNIQKACVWSYAFNNTKALVNLTVDGEIGAAIDLKSCVDLSKASITSVMNALSTATSGITVTFSKTAITNAFGSTDNAEWEALKATRPNWTISLA